jgi:hypothetical protein
MEHDPASSAPHNAAANPSLNGRIASRLSFTILDQN